MKSKKTVLTIIFSILGVFALGIIGGGIFLAVKIYNDNQEEAPTDYKDSDFEDDNDALYARYLASHDGDLTKQYKTYELANISIYKFKDHNYYYSKTYGLATSFGIDQTIRASVIKNNDSYFMENLSSGLVKTAKRFYQSNQTVSTYDGKIETSEKALWDEEPLSKLSLEEHEAQWGKELSRPLIYIISSKTVLETSTSESTENGYVVHLDLHTEFSTLRYKRQIVSISSVKKPTFKSVHLDLTMDKDMNLTKMDISEDYSVVMILETGVSATYSEYYTYDKELAIPDLKTDIEY